MMTDDIYPDDQDEKDESDQGTRKEISPETGKPGNNSGENFLDMIESLALRQKNILSPEASGSSNDLTSITINDFPVVESDQRTIRKIEELNSIVRAIESRPASNADIHLDRSYKINYNSELNSAQLEAVVTLNGPFL